MRPANTALAGVRVLDFTWSVAGPTITTVLAALGAEVIKVEWPLRPDMMRQTMFATGIKPTLDSGCFYASVNPGKLGFTCDVKGAPGRALVKRLIPEVDLVTESFSAGVLESWGLGYEDLCELKDDIILLRLCGFGHSGRYHKYTTWGPTAQAFNGLTAMSGLPGEAPAGYGFSYMDVMAGYMGALAALTAIFHHRRTGEGQYIDMSQVEAGIGLTGAALLDASANGHFRSESSQPPGNRAVWPTGAPAAYRGEWGAPYNCYPAKGTGRFDFCAISVLRDDEWLALKQELGNPDWADQPRFDTAAGRVANQAFLDDKLSQWTRQYEKRELMERLQRAGVPCGAVQSMEDLMERDPQVAHREAIVEAEHPLLGPRRWQALPIHLSGSPRVLPSTWPLYGQDNKYVLSEILKLSDHEVSDLESANTFWPKDLPREIEVGRALW